MDNLTNSRNIVIENTDFSNTNSLNHLLEDDTDYQLSSPKVSSYVEISEFTKELYESQSKISILSLNICSIHAKFDEFKIVIDQINEHHQVTVICIQETWLSSDDSLNNYQLEGYHLISKGKYCAAHGGLIIYLRDDFEYKIENVDRISDFTQSNNNSEYGLMWENLTIEIKHKTPNSKKYIVCNMYRVPNEIVGHLNTFTDIFSGFLNVLHRTGRTVYVCGDTNINLLKINEKRHYANFFENVLSSGFYPKINLPTRFDKVHGTGSLIDNIFTNEIDENVSGIFINEISDHQMIYTMCKTPGNNRRDKLFIDIETNNPHRENLFLNELRHINLTEKINQNPFANPNINYDILIELITKAKQKHIPKRRVKFNKKKHKMSPWMTNGILKSINTKDKLFKEITKLSPSSPDYIAKKINFKTYKSIIRRSIRDAKRLYYCNMFNKYSNDLKKTWQTINHALNNNIKNSTFPSTFEQNDGKILTDHKSIANAFNKYFINIGEPAADNSNEPINEFSKYLKTKPDCNLKFDTITIETTLHIINTLKPKSSTGIDQISNKLIKSMKDIIAEPLTIIINQMLNTGIFPNSLKVSKVIPLFKKDDPQIFSNYRPISLLPSLSKIFEKAIFLQLSYYLEFNSLINSNQYGFRKKHSTELASLHLVDILNYQLDSKNIPLNIYLDLSKAFDSLNHNILLRKLKFYGITGIALNLFSSYMQNRKQFVSFDSTCSDLGEIKHGVPQGSILGPILFLIYISMIYHLQVNSLNVLCMLMTPPSIVV